MKFMFEDEVRALFSGLRRCESFPSDFEKTRAIAILSLAYGLGLRLGEIKRLRHDEIDFSKRLLRINRQKNKSVSILPMSSRVIFDLQQYLREKQKLRLEAFHFISSRLDNPMCDKGYYRLSKFIREKIYP